jgi:hypothetical protein
MFMDVRMCECVVCLKGKSIKYHRVAWSSLRHYIGPKKPSCTNGDAYRIHSANYEPDLNSGIFFLFGPCRYLRSERSVRK